MAARKPMLARGPRKPPAPPDPAALDRFVTTGKVTVDAESTEKPKATTVYLYADEHEALRRRAFDERVTMAELMRRALRAYLGMPQAHDSVTP